MSGSGGGGSGPALFLPPLFVVYRIEAADIIITAVLSASSMASKNDLLVCFMVQFKQQQTTVAFY